MSRLPGLHHLLRRKHQKLDLTFFDHAMILVGFIYPFTMVPQIMKIVIEQDAGSVSLLTYGAKFFFVIPWFVYGLLHKSTPIMCSNAMWFVTYLVLVVQIVKY